MIGFFWRQVKRVTVGFLMRRMSTKSSSADINNFSGVFPFTITALRIYNVVKNDIKVPTDYKWVILFRSCTF